VRLVQPRLLPAQAFLAAADALSGALGGDTVDVGEEGEPLLEGQRRGWAIEGQAQALVEGSDLSMAEYAGESCT